jgi:hypothetical protein
MKDPLELLNCSESRFPAMVAVVRPATVTNNSVLLNFELLFMDLVHKDLSNEIDVLNDQLLIALDCRAYLNNPDNDDLFIVGENLQLNPFYEKSDNEVTGWSMTIQCRVQDLKDRCIIPV